MPASVLGRLQMNMRENEFAALKTLPELPTPADVAQNGNTVLAPTPVFETGIGDRLTDDAADSYDSLITRLGALHGAIPDDLTQLLRLWETVPPEVRANIVTLAKAAMASPRGLE